MHISKFPSIKVQVSRWAKIESLLTKSILFLQMIFRTCTLDLSMKLQLLEMILPLPYPRKSIQNLKKNHEMSFMLKKIFLILIFLKNKKVNT